MEKITNIEVTGECDEGLIFFVEYEEEYEYDDETYTTREFDSITLNREKAQNIADNVEGIINRDEIVVDGETKLSSFEVNGRRFTLYIEEHDFPKEVDVDGGAPFLTEVYEIGMAHRDGAEMLKNLNYNIQEIEGCAFRLSADEPRCLSYISLVDTLEIESPYDKGWFTLQPGDYRVWDEVEEI